MSRFERLRYDEEFEGNRVRPSPKTEDGTNLFHEEPVISFSNLSKDDLQIFVEDEADNLKTNRMVDRALSRMK